MTNTNSVYRPDLLTEQDDASQSVAITEYLHLLWYRRKLIIAITIFVSVIGYVKVSEIVDVYSATSTLLVADTPQTNIVDIEGVLNPYYYTDIDAEIEVLRSKVLANKVVDKLNLTSHPEFNPSIGEPEKTLLQTLHPRSWLPASWVDSIKEALGQETEVVLPAPLVSSQPLNPEELRLEQQKSTAASLMLSKLSLQAVGRSEIIQITIQANDPAIAAAIANELPETYLLDQLESKFEATEKANQWLTDQLAALEIKVIDSERAIEIYRAEHDLGEESGLSILDAQLSELNSQLIIARAERAELTARLTQLQRLLAGGGLGVETATEVMSSALVQQLRTQEAQALGRQSELSVELGSKHPRMLQVQAELIDIRQRVRKEVERIVAGLENEAEFARTRVASLEGSLGIARGETSAQNKEEIQLRSLERDAAANRTLFETFLERYKETSTTQGMETSDARILSLSSVPSSPSYPNRTEMMTNFVLMGFLGACGLVLALQFLNPGMTSPEQVQNLLKEYVLGLVPLIPGKVAMHDHVLENPGSSLVESINSLKFALDLSDPDHPVKVVQITSSVPAEGKTTLAIAFARVVAASGKKVLILDGDLRRSSVGKRIGLREKHKGLSDLVLAGDEDLSEFILRDEKGGLDYLSPGTAKYANATDIFSSLRMHAIIEDLKSRYDLVVVDSPPVMVVADARIMGRIVDKTIFVVRWDKTPRKVAKAAMDQLRRAKVSVAGIVLQQVDLKRYGRLAYGGSAYYYHYGRYGNYYTS